MNYARILFLISIWLCGVSLAPAAMAAGKPQRVVSLNVCADQLVLLLAQPEAIKSVTWLARDPDISGVAEQAQNVPINYGLTEEIVPLAPDLVVAGVYTARTTVAFLKRLGIPVLDLDIPQSIAAMLKQVRVVAGALGETEQGERLIASLNTRLAALPHIATQSRPLAAVWRPNASAAGRGSLIDAVLQRAGLDNLATHPDMAQHGQLSLESLLLGYPDILILNSDNEKLPSLAHELMRHQAVAAAFPPTRTAVVPERLWACGGPGVVEAIEILSRAAHAVALRKAKEASIDSIHGRFVKPVHSEPVKFVSGEFSDSTQGKFEKP